MTQVKTNALWPVQSSNDHLSPFHKVQVYAYQWCYFLCKSIHVTFVRLLVKPGSSYVKQAC